MARSTSSLDEVSLQNHPNGLDLNDETSLYQHSQTENDPEKLRQVVAKLYGRLLEFVNELGRHEESTQQLINTYDRHICSLKDNLSSMQRDLDGQRCIIDDGRRREADLVARAFELEATTATLTEWNTRLDQENRELERNLAKEHYELGQEVIHLQDQILAITEKRIENHKDFTRLEEENTKLKRSIKEQHDLQAKLFQENAILKSRLFNLSAEGGKFEETSLRRGHELMAVEINQRRSPLFTRKSPRGSTSSLSLSSKPSLDSRRSLTAGELSQRPLQFDTVDLSC